MKIEHILYPVDFSQNSLALTSEVEWLAEHYKARVTLLHVFQVPTAWHGSPLMLTSETYTAHVKAEKEQLKCIRLALPKSQIRRIFEDGDPAAYISQWSKDHSVDLIMMGTQGNGGLSRMLLGSVAMKVLHQVSCPVWTHSTMSSQVRNPYISKIICLVKPSKEAIPLLRFTQELSSEFGTKASLLYSLSGEESAFIGLSLDRSRSLKNAVETMIINLQTEAGTDFPIRITEQPIAEDVAEVARQQGADLIVTGRGVSQRTLGTWRTGLCTIVRQAPCPVLSLAVGLSPEIGVTSPAIELAGKTL